MRTHGLRLLVITVLTGALFMPHAVIADDTIPAAQEDRVSVVNLTGPDGFVTQLPAVDSDKLAEQLDELRSLLIARKQELTRELAEDQLDTGDAVLTILLPGGLLYAGYRKAVYEHTRHALEEVSEDIDEFSRDLAFLQGQMSPVAVARLK